MKNLRILCRLPYICMDRLQPLGLHTHLYWNIQLCLLIGLTSARDTLIKTDTLFRLLPHGLSIVIFEHLKSVLLYR